MVEKDQPRRKHPSDLTDEQWAIVDRSSPAPSRADEEGASEGQHAGSLNTRVDLNRTGRQWDICRTIRCPRAPSRTTFSSGVTMDMGQAR